MSDKPTVLPNSPEWQIEELALAIHGTYAHECTKTDTCREIAAGLWKLGYRATVQSEVAPAATEGEGPYCNECGSTMRCTFSDEHRGTVQLLCPGEDQRDCGPQANFVQVVAGSQVVTLEHIRNVVSMRLLPGLDESWADAAIKTLDEAINKQAKGPTIVAHGDGAETMFHPFGQVCAKCRPPVEITDEMVATAISAWVGGDDQRLREWGPNDADKAAMRAALEAAING